MLALHLGLGEPDRVENQRDDGPQRHQFKPDVRPAEQQGPGAFRRQSLALMGRPDQTATLAAFRGPALVLMGDPGRAYLPKTGLVALALVFRGGPDGSERLAPQWWGILGLIGWAQGYQSAHWMTFKQALERVIADPSVRIVKLQDMIDETKCLLDGTSPVTKGRLALLAQAEGLLAL